MATSDSVSRSRAPRQLKNATPTPTSSRAYPARVIVVDAYDLPRSGMRGLLSGVPELEVITEASDGQQAVALSRRLHPDLVLMELHLPTLDGVSATRLIRRDSPDTLVVLLTSECDPECLRMAFEAGVAGILLKTDSRAEVLDALRRVLAGERVLNKELATSAPRRAGAVPAGTGTGLTAREHEVLRLVAGGKTNQEIGVALAVSTRTAKAHVERIIARLGVANRAEAVAKAIGLGMLTPSVTR